jgi:hypothetical protein
MTLLSPDELDEQREKQKWQRRANDALRVRVTLALSAIALAAAIVTYLTTGVSAHTAGNVLGFVLILILLLQIAGRGLLIHADQMAIVQSSEEAAEELKSIKSDTEAELRLEKRHSQNLELLLNAMQNLNLVELRSPSELEQSRPATLFYLKRHAAAILSILEGYWDRSEFLQPVQLWQEYAELIPLLREGDLFLSTVCIPADPINLFHNSSFRKYVASIIDAVEAGRIEARRLFIFGQDTPWPPNLEDLHPSVCTHFQELQAVEHATNMLKVRATSEKIARMRFQAPDPDFMVWGDGLLIESNLAGEGGLVTNAKFFFADGTEGRMITKRKWEFDQLFEDEDDTRPISDFLTG